MSSTENKAVFLSYASQDAEAARRICESLRAGGVEVWFDANGGLEHGDEWDAKIRRQVKECVLFIPIISANTQAREEGYFRLEWDMAAERARSIACGVAFILPIVIDDTKEPVALVPDRFRTVQWTRLPGVVVPPDVQQRFLKLWSHRTGVLKQQAVNTSAAPVVSAPSAAEANGKPGAKNFVFIAATVAVIVVGIGWSLIGGRGKPAASAPVAVTASLAPKPAIASMSEARQLAEKARAMFDSIEGTRDDYKLAEELIAQAKARDATDAEVCAAEAQLHERFLQRGWDTSDARREAARAAVQRAMRLDPQSFEARFAQAFLLGYTGDQGRERVRQLRELRRERPTDQRILRALASGLYSLNHFEGGIAISNESAALPGGDPLALYSKGQYLWFAGRTAEAEAAIEASIAQKPFPSALLLNVWFKANLHGDLESARALLNRINPAELIEDRACYFAFYIEWLARRPDAAIGRLAAVPRDWLNDNFQRGPKATLVGDAHQLAGRPDAAALEWRAALKLVDQRLAANPNDARLLAFRFSLLARLGQREEAERQFAVVTQVARMDDEWSPFPLSRAYILLGRKAEAIRQISLGLKRDTRAVQFTAADLRLNPDWDPLRGEPAFAAVVAEAEAIENAAALPRGGGSGAVVNPKPDDKSTLADKSVAVLAFANLSDDKGNEYFSDGISEELLNVLAKVPGLKVTARTSSFHFKGKDTPIPAIAQQLGVAYVVEGSVRKQGDKVRITAQLVKATDGFHVWSDTFTRDLKDIFAVQDEIAGLIAKSLKLKLGAGDSARDKSTDLAAWQSYLDGRRAWNLRTMEGYREAETHLQRAIALDARFARAYAALADVWQLRAIDENAGVFSRQWRTLPTAIKSRALIDRALEIDPLCAEAYASLGMNLQLGWQDEPALQAYRRAIELNPNYATAHQWLGLALLGVGRMDETLSEVKQAAELDPLSHRILSDYAKVLNLSGHPGEALVVSRRALAIQPGAALAVLQEARALAMLGHPLEAVALVEGVKKRDITERMRPETLAILAMARQPEAIRRLIGDVDAMPASTAKFASLVALGRIDEAFAQVESSIIEDGWSIVEAAYGQLFEPIRNDARFKQMIETSGRAEYFHRAQAWRAAHPPEKPEAKK